MGPKQRNDGGESAASASDSPGPSRRKSRAGDDNPSMLRRLSVISLPARSKDLLEEGRRRRDSTFSAYSIISEANKAFQEEILFPGPATYDTATWKSRLPIMFAVVPPLVGLFFNNGASFCNDLILLGLSGVFLHWATTSPWNWYYAAQLARKDHNAAEESLDLGRDRSGSEGSEPVSPTGVTLSPEERQERARRTRAARNQLRTLEVVALIGCFVAPAIATYFLYVVRGFLNWPSEGLFSNLNLGIVFMATEVGPLSHSIKLVLAHTLHLQRIVNNDPYRMVRITPTRYNALLARVTELEARVLAQPAEGCEGCQCNNPERKQALVKQVSKDATREVRAAIQPDLDAVIRAVRRYEKKSSTLAQDVDQKMSDLRGRLDDAIALSAVVARNSTEKRGLVGKVVRGGFHAATLPMTGSFWVGSLLLTPFTVPLNWLTQNGRRLIAEGGLQGGIHGMGGPARGQAQGRVRMDEPGRMRRSSPSTATSASRAS